MAGPGQLPVESPAPTGSITQPQLARASNLHPLHRSSGSSGIRIRDAAAHVLAHQGYFGLRMDDVAKRAQVRPGAIYYYYASREELIEDVLWSGMARLRAQLEVTLSHSASASATERLRLAVEVHLRHELAVSDYTQASIRHAGQVPPAIQQRQRAEFHRYRAIWLELVQDLRVTAGLPPALDTGWRTMLAIGALNWTAEWWHDGRKGLDELISGAFAFIHHGLLSAGDDVTGSRRAQSQKRYGAAETSRTATRERILAATASTLREHGYAKTQMAEIARRAGVTPPAIYHHFPSRNALITTVLTEGQRVLQQHMTDSTRTAIDATPEERVSEMTAAYLTAALELSDFVTAVTRNARQVPAELHATLSQQERALIATWRSVTAEAHREQLIRPGIDSTHAAMLTLGALTWTTEWWSPAVQVAGLIECAVDFICAGLFEAKVDRVDHRDLNPQPLSSGARDCGG